METKEKRNPNEIEDHGDNCPFGQADGPDDFCKDCECEEGWFDGDDSEIS